jgi:hypothetical protein
VKKRTQFIVGFGALALVGALVKPHGDTTASSADKLTSADNRMTRRECADMEAALDSARADYNQAAQMIAEDRSGTLEQIGGYKLRDFHSKLVFVTAEWQSKCSRSEFAPEARSKCTQEKNAALRKAFDDIDKQAQACARSNGPHCITDQMHAQGEAKKSSGC